MRNRISSYILVIIIIMMAIFAMPASAVTESAASTRLHFVSAMDANMYTERIVYEVFKRLGIEVSIGMEEMSIALQGVNAGVYDGICNQTKGVEQNYDQLVGIPVETAVCDFYALTVQGDSFVCDSWEDLGGKRVGTLAGKTFIASSLPSDAEHIEKPSMTLLYESLRSGECDVIVIADTSDKDADQLVILDGTRIAGTVDTHSCRIFLNKKHAALVDRITNELEKMQQDGSIARLKAMKPLHERTEKVVLYLSSYSSEMPWEQNIVKGIGNILDQHTDIIFHNIALNAYRNTDQALLELAALSTISIDFLHSPPDAVIASDNEAMNFLMCNYNSILPNDIPIVYCGINSKALIEAQRYDDYVNLQGVVETISAADTAEQMLKLFPETEEIYIINDYTLTGKRWRGEIETQLESFKNRVKTTYNENMTFDELMTEVSGLGNKTLILSGSYYLDKENRFTPQPSFQYELSKKSSVPIFGLLDTGKGYGQLGGKYIDSILHGEAAANMMVEIIRSGNSDQYTYIEREQDSRFVFDWNVMQKYGIKKSQLPKGSVILNVRVNLRDSDPVLFYGLIIAAVSFAVITIIMTIFIIALQRRNKKLVLADADIRKSHNEIEATKNHLQTVLETAPIAYSLLVDDIVVESNKYYKENIGLETGRKNVEKYERQTRYLELMQECRKRGYVEHIYWNLPEADGKRNRYLYNIATTKYEDQEAIVMWGVEIEQLEQQKDALNRAYYELEELVESTPLPIALIYPEGKSFLFANSSWKSLFKIPGSTAISSMQWGAEGILTQRPMDELIQKAMDGNEVVSHEWKFETFDGEPFDAMVYLKKIEYGGKDCLVVTHQDLREERSREHMLQNAAEKEREANRLKSHFLMNMSHEIRTPMNAIIGITQLAKPTDETEKLFESINQIGHSATVLLNIINDVLDLSLIEDGKMILDPEEISLSQIIFDVDTVVAVEADKKHIKRNVYMEDVIHDTVLADVSRLQQIIIILANNAVKFTPEGGEISLTIKETEGSGDASAFLFAVRDTGIGIEPEKMSRLFKAFEQGDDSITRQYGGAGLGLSIAKNIVEMMGGGIWVESEIGKGSTFFFSVQFPILSDRTGPLEEAVNTAAASEKVNDQGEIDFSKLRILVVDDVDINRMIAVTLLNELEVSTEEAENGRRAVEMIAESAPGYYDLIFMDVQMPVLDGCSATKQIRLLDHPDAILPIIAMTANVMPDDVKMVMDAGMDGYIGKPVFIDPLIDIIKSEVKQ